MSEDQLEKSKRAYKEAQKSFGRRVAHFLELDILSGGYMIKFVSRKWWNPLKYILGPTKVIRKPKKI